MMRYHKEINLIKEIIDSGQLGRITSSHINWSTYLPDWHPWEDYSESYASNSEMGGGAILTCSHEIDTMNYLLENLSFKLLALALQINFLPIQMITLMLFL